LIGYSIEIRSCGLFDPQENKVIIRRDVLFDEYGFFYPQHAQIELIKDLVDIDDEPNSK